ncbi:MAG: thiol peroxidase [candidate division Zixibacteria bacterium]|nr:thiol peroxidase [candidate division Zixibacteria bacterium]
MADERSKVVTMFDKPMTLLGPGLTAGDKAPDYTLLDNSLRPVTLADSAGKIRLISVVPSLDTEVCDIQTKMFAREVKKTSEDILFYTVSMDLPFAQKRWVEENKISDTITLSDFNDANFGLNYGLLLKEIRLLTRAVLIIDSENNLPYFEIVPEIHHEPNYADSLEALRNLK